jgi:hypothetical protein
MKPLTGAALALLMMCGAAHAETPIELYRQGKFEAAIAAGMAAGDAEGYATAARSELAAETMAPDRCLDCIRRAEADARKAIAADPKLVDGHLFLAVALGRESRLIGMIAAAANGNPAKVKSELDKALACDPQDATVIAALGGWNIEMVHGGGRMMARMVFGASVEQGLHLFAKAFELAPAKLPLRYQYALTLSALDIETYRKDVEDALVRATEDKPESTYEAFAQQRAKKLLATLRGDDLATFSEMVSRDQGYPQ